MIAVQMISVAGSGFAWSQAVTPEIQPGAGRRRGVPCSCLRWLLAVPRVAGPICSVTDAQGGTTPVPPWVTPVLHLYSWAGAHLTGICLSFRNGETKEFCFAQSSDLWVPRFVCGRMCSGQLLLLLPVLAWSGHDQGVGSPQNLILRAHGGGWPGVLPFTALPGVSLTPPPMLSLL